MAGSVRATNPLFQNNSSLYFVWPSSSPPVYDVTAFDNENVFNIKYTTIQTFYETLNTYYYTNAGAMVVAGSANLTGFKFDTLTTNVIPRKKAGTFNNPGTIRCNSTIDGGLFSGKLIVDATNIISPGNISVGASGEINLSSINADLSYGSLTIEDTTRFAASGAVGIGGSWIPAFQLSATSASSSTPNQVSAFPCKEYFKVSGSPTNQIIRAVFIANNSPNVPYNVYFGNPGNPSLGNGAYTIEWTGINQDPATCTFFTNYLYLNDLFEQVATSNNFVGADGVPNNLTFFQSSTPLMTSFTPQAQDLVGYNFQPNTVITPNYSSCSVQFLSTTVATNASGANPSGALTNLPAKILITASNDLNLVNVQMNGANYVSLVAPNQFDGSDNSTIVAPYSDINLGVTNGKLNVVNLVAPRTSSLGGNLQAWTGQWNYVNAGGVSYDFRVLIVSSQLLPQTQSYVQNLRLHATNSLVISDVMNVFQSLSIDAQNLTLTTNTCGNGFTSFDGELNWDNTFSFGPTQIPNVLWLTNNGAIRAWNDATFGSLAVPYSAFVNRGMVGDNGTKIWTTNFINAGAITNGTGGFTLTAQRSLMTNALIYANGIVSLTTSNLVITNGIIFAGRSLSIVAPDFLTDVITNLPPNSAFSGNNWVVGSNAVANDGLSLPVKPARGDLLGTTITSIAPTNTGIVHLWSGLDRGYSVTGFSNNAAIGHLVLDALGAAPKNGRFTFNAASANAAIYVDEIEFKDYSTNFSSGASLNMNGITFAPSLVIYYAQAILNGKSIAEKLNLGNTNNGVNNQNSHFRWMPTYAGYFSSTNLINPDGTTNTVNKALAESGSIDSDGDGLVNNADSTPFFLASQINLTATLTNAPAQKVKIVFQTIPGATNFVYYTTNLTAPNWQPYTNFNNYYWNSNGLAVSNYAHANWFPAPQVYGKPATNVWVFDTVTNVQRFYRVSVLPWLTYPF